MQDSSDFEIVRFHNSPVRTYTTSSSAYFAIIFLSPCDMKLIVSFRSSPSPSVRSIVPFPKRGCRIRVPIVHLPPEDFRPGAAFAAADGVAAAGLRMPPPRARVTASTELYVDP